MSGGLVAAWARCQHRVGVERSPGSPSGAPTQQRSPPMQWHTPTATDLRFGFEITMYVAAR